jgi:O-antigen ligase
VFLVSLGLLLDSSIYFSKSSLAGLSFFALFILWCVFSLAWTRDVNVSVFYCLKYFVYLSFTLAVVTAYRHRHLRLLITVLSALTLGVFIFVLRYFYEFCRGGGLGIIAHPSSTDFFSEMCAFSASFGGGKNLLGSWLCFGYTFVAPVFLLYRPRSKMAKGMLLVAAPVLLLTFSRTAFLGLAFFGGATFLLMKRNAVRSILRSLPIRFFVLIAVLIFALNPFDLRSKFIHRLIDPLLYYQGKANDLGAMGRQALWSEAWQVIEESPIIGTGIGILGTGKTKYVEDNFHNVYLQILAQTGFVGLFLFGVWSFVLFAMAAAISHSSPHRDPRDVLFGKILLLNLLTYYFKSLFMFQYFDLEIWTLIIFVVCEYGYLIRSKTLRV